MRNVDYPFYRPEAPQIFRRLPELRPTALYIFGGASPVSPPHLNEERLAQTGSGIGGSGGPKEGRVKGVTFEGVGHLVPMEAVSRTAEVSAEWIGHEIKRVQEEERRWQRDWGSKTLKEKQEIDDVWRERMGGVRSGGKL